MHASNKSYDARSAEIATSSGIPQEKDLKRLVAYVDAAFAAHCDVVPYSAGTFDLSRLFSSDIIGNRMRRCG